MGTPQPSPLTGLDSIRIRACTTLVEFADCVALQRQLRGPAEPDFVPKEILVVATKVGGHVLGAYDAGTLIGFVVASPGFRAGRVFLHSLLLAMMPAYEHSEVQRRLQLSQREDALARGVELLEWTFDPLALTQAQFYLEGLGVIVRRFERNLYGRATGRGTTGLPTDRLVAEWWLKAPRVERLLGGLREGGSRETVQVSLPATIGQLRQSHPAEAERIQAEMGRQLESWLKDGYAVTGFELTPEVGTYLLEAYTG